MTAEEIDIISFKLRTLIAIPVGAAFILFSIVLIDRAIPQHWIGRADVSLRFRVTNGITGAPIPDAPILLTDYTGKKITMRTDQSGLAIIDLELKAAGRSSLAGRTRSVDYGEWEIQVDADGFRQERHLLSYYTRSHIYHSNDRPPEIPIRMASKNSGER